MADTTLSIQIEVQSQELKRLRKEHDTLVRKIQGDWKTTSRRVKNDSDKMFRGLKAGFRSVGVAMVAMKLVAFGRSIVRVGVRMEGLRNGLLAVEGSTKAASKAMKELQEISLLPGISLSQAIEARINLRAVKLDADLANRSIKAMGNALAIVGKSDELTGVVLGMTQMVSSGKVLQEEISQISSRIPMFRQAMKDAFGTARSEEIQKMGISVEDFLGRTVAQLEKLPKATGGAANAISNLGNAFTKFGDNLFQKFLPQFKATVEFMGDVVDKAAGVVAPSEGLQTPALIERFRQEDLSGQVVRRFRRQVFRTPNPNIERNRRALGGASLDVQSLRSELAREFSATDDPIRRQELIRQGRELEAIQQRFTFGVDPLEVARRRPSGGRTRARRGAGGVSPTLQPRVGQGFTPLTRNARFLGDPDFLPQVETRRQHELPQLIQSVPTPIPRVVPFGGDLDVFRTPVIRALQPQLQVTAESARIAEAGRLANLPRPVPIGAQPFPGAETFRKGMKDISMSTIQATQTITNAFANMAAEMENSTLRVVTSLLDMVSNILAAVQQGGGSGIGGAFTALGLGVGAATGLGIGFAAVGGGFAVANTIISNQNRNQSTRVQTRFLRTN